MVEIFLERAKQLSEARKLIELDTEYASATALLAVHSAIALNDAILLKLSGRIFRGEDHMAAVREVTKRCRARRLDTSGITQLKALVAAKTRISYGPQSVTFAYAYELSVASRRFAVWSYKRLEEIA
jgi:hypothetical protein